MCVGNGRRCSGKEEGAPRMNQEPSAVGKSTHFLFPCTKPALPDHPSGLGVRRSTGSTNSYDRPACRTERPPGCPENYPDYRHREAFRLTPGIAMSNSMKVRAMARSRDAARHPSWRYSGASWCGAVDRYRLHRADQSACVVDKPGGRSLRVHADRVWTMWRRCRTPGVRGDVRSTCMTGRHDRVLAGLCAIQQG